MKQAKINLLTLIILLSQSLYSQDKYNPGYLVTIKNDTINGFILNKIDSELAYNISFKKDLLDKNIIVYNSNELLGFGFNSGRVFERKKLEDNHHTAKDSLNVFAKRIVKGKIDLYVWRHKKDNSKDFFITNNTSKREVHLQEPKKSEVKLDGKTYSKKDNKYMNDLIFIKMDENTEPSKIKDVRYGEKSISKDIISFDKNYQEKYPMEIYKEPFKYSYDALVGIPFNLNADELNFRIAVYRNKNFIEKSNTISYINGIIYQYWSNKNEKWGNQFQYGTSNYRSQILNIVPVGVKFQTNSKKIIPYGYVGLGAMVVMNSDYIIENYDITGTQNSFTFLPTVNIGAGVKIKVNNNFILTEITPALNGIFFNVGYSF